MSDDIDKESLKPEDDQPHISLIPKDLSSSEHVDENALHTNEYNVNCLRNMLHDYNNSQLINHIEENYHDKDRIVNSLMENLYKIISDAELIKCQIPKPPSQAKSLTTKKQGQSRSDLECFNRSTMSKRSITSNRSKMLTYKPPTSKIVVPNKYSVMSPKVSINIGFNKKSNNADNESVSQKQVEINLEDKSRLKGKFEKDLDSSLNSTKTSIKKLNSKRNNLSNPTFVEATSNSISEKKKPKYASSNCSLNTMTPQKTNKEDDSNMVRSSNSTYKFEPKKKTIHSNLESPITQHTTCKNSQDIKVTRNSSSQELNKLTSSKFKSHKYLDLQPLEDAQKKYYGFKSCKIESMFTNPKFSKIQSTILRFLKPNESIKLRLLSSSMLSQFIECSSARIKKDIEKRKQNYQLKNPFDDLLISNDLINKVMKADLILSDFLVISSNHKYMTPFVNCLYILVSIGEIDFEGQPKKSLEEQIKFLESNSLNKNCYFFYPTIIENLHNDQNLYKTLKNMFDSGMLNLSFVDFQLPNISFKYYNDFIKHLKKILETDRMTECLLDCEILEDKIEKVRDYLMPKR